MSDQQNWQNQVWQQPQPHPAPQPQPGQQQFAYAPQYPVQQQKKGKGWIVGLAIVFALLVLLIFGMVTCTSLFSSSLGGSFSGSYDEADFVTGDAVGIIAIDGTIQYDNTNSSPEGLKAQLDRAEQNPNIKAVVLRVNSGGGTATAGEEMSLYVKEFSKPIVVSSASVNASAAYQISSQADYIFTAKTTAIGSIGTALSITDLSGLFEKLGIRIEDITSAESKDSSYGNRPLTEEERQYFQDMVNEINETFIETVAEGRGMSIEDVRELATGLTFTGMSGVANGLADEIGTLEDACDKAASLAGIEQYSTVNLRQASSLDVLSLLDLFGYSSSDDIIATLKELENDGALAN